MQRMNILKSILTAGILALGVSAAQAATVIVDLTGLGAGTSFDAGGVDLDVTASFFNSQGQTKTLGTGAVGTGTPSVLNTALGLGEVYSNTTTGNLGQVNGDGTFREALILTFGSSVKLISATFAGFGGNGLFFNGQTATVAANGFALASSLGFGVTGNSFGFGAVGGGYFYLSSVTVEVPDVPVPAAGLMLGSLVLLPLLRRKRRS